MNTLHLHYITEIERTGSISQAAEALYMGQPNLSRVLHEMEQTIGFAIFDRTSRGVKPTARGAAFLRHAHNILRETEHIESLDPNSPAEQRFYIGLPQARTLVDAAVGYLAELDPSRKLDARIRELSSRDALDALAAGTLDLAIIRYPASHEDFFSTEAAARQLTLDFLWEYRYGVILNRDNPLANAEYIDIDDLRKLTELSRDDTLQPFGGNSRGRVIHTQLHALQFSLMERMPDCYMWSAAVTPSILERRNLIFRTVQSSERRCHDALVYDMRLALSTMEQNFLEYVLKYLADQHFE